MLRIVKCVPTLTPETLRTRLDQAAKDGTILEMFCVDALGSRPIRFTVLPPSENDDGLRTYAGSTRDGHELNVHLRASGCMINIAET
jgi:hypothetical protein